MEVNFDKLVNLKIKLDSLTMKFGEFMIFLSLLQHYDYVVS